MEHVVLFKWKENVTTEALEEIAQGIIALKDSVPGVIDLAYGKDVTISRSKGFTHMLVVRLTGRDMLQGYAEHPEHLKVLVKIREAAEDVMALDIESPRYSA